MREILFRGKPTDSNAWVYGQLLNFEKYDGGKNYCVTDIFSPQAILVRHSYDWNDNIHFVREETVCEWTGLYDSNGTRIFEKDVLGVVAETKKDGKYPHSVSVTAIVSFQKGAFVFLPMLYPSCAEIERINLIWPLKETDFGKHEYTYTVIGNTIDDPEFLEK